MDLHERRGLRVDRLELFQRLVDRDDVVHRVVGPPGIVLVGEGQPSRVKNLLAAEGKKHTRVAGGAPVITLIAGQGEGEIDIRKLTKHVMKLPQALQPSEITDLLQRLKALDAVREILARVVQEGLPEAEIAAGKRQLRGQLVLSMEGVSSRMYRAATTALYNEPHRSIDELLALVDAVDAETVLAVAREYFDPTRQIVVSLGPKAVA